MKNEGDATKVAIGNLQIARKTAQFLNNFRPLLSSNTF